MAHKILVTIEFGDDGTYSCYSEQPIGDYALIDECRQAYPEDERYTGLTFEYKYDLRSFFNYFNFLNVTEIAKRAGINPSLMRQYTSGVKTAGETTYKKLSSCISQIRTELQTASF